MKLYHEILLRFYYGCIAGALGGLGLAVLMFVNYLSSRMNAGDITTFYYLGFGTIILAIILGAYDLSRIRKIVDSVKSGQTSIE